jgi:hypothetical protein
MEETPPRRRRPPSGDGGPSLPFIPIVLGVIILGFVIGAGLSVAGRHSPSQDAVPAATATPIASATPLAAAPAATLAPGPLRASPRVTAKPSARAVALKASPAPTASPEASPAGSPPATASPVPTATAAAGTPAPAKTTARPGAAIVPPRKRETPAPAAMPASATAEPATPAPPTPAPATTPAAVAHDDVTSDFGRLAAGVVRAYLAAVARGDTAGAYAQLGTTPDVATPALPETGIVTAATRIVHVEARGGENAVTVNVDMQTPSGAYFGQYTVHRSSTGAAIIVQHSIFKS